MVWSRRSPTVYGVVEASSWIDAFPRQRIIDPLQRILTTTSIAISVFEVASRCVSRIQEFPDKA